MSYVSAELRWHTMGCGALKWFCLVSKFNKAAESWSLLLKRNTTAEKVRSLTLIWSLKCQRQSSRPPVTSAHAGEARSTPFISSCSHFLHLLSLLSACASPGGAFCVTRTMCLCPPWIWRLFCFIIKTQVFFVVFKQSQMENSTFPLVATWPSQLASSIRKILLILLVAARGLERAA